MFTKYIGLISQTRKVPLAQLSQIAAAIQKQLTRDFYPVWKIPATIQAFAGLEDLPTDYWPILIMDDINTAGASGVHLDRNGQPYSLVQADDNTSLTCSHECLEMLADPFGNRFVASDSIKPGQGRVNYLVEVCDPSEAINFAYKINGVLVSDFYTPNYFDPVTAPGIRYSFSGKIQQPKQLLKGGYISWMLPETGEWWQANLFGSEISYSSLGVLSKEEKSWRELIDGLTYQAQSKANTVNDFIKSDKKLTAVKSSVIQAASGRATQLRVDINNLFQASLQVPKTLETQFFLSGGVVPSSAYNPLDVIRIVLDTAGQFGVPANLPGIRKKKLVANLGYLSYTYDALLINLNQYLGTINAGKTLSGNDVNACDTVGDVVDLVEL